MTSPSHGSKEGSLRKGRKFINVTVYFLDDSSHIFQLQAKSLGQALFEKVCKFTHLLEVDYFGLEFLDDKNTKCWLEALKPLGAQVPNAFPTMHFCVKFYTPDPVQLEDEYTRYLFGLQLKKDLIEGHLQCNDNTAAVLISYLVQADFGDFNAECSSYLSGWKFFPQQDAELEKKIMDNHKKLIGQTPAEADLNLLETARRCELYGVKMTAAKDQDGVPLNLAVAHLGVLVFQNVTKINTFSWAKIRKLSFKRKKFLIKLHPEGYGYYKDTVEFVFDGRNECKNFWKRCIEHHTFFRCTDAKLGMRRRIFSRGSSFRYSGRTQKQVSELVRDSCFKRQPFQRSTSLRSPSSPSKSVGSGNAVPSPLLPVNPPEPPLPDSPQGLVTPESDVCSDFLCDDNVSHDSYNVPQTNNNNNCDDDGLLNGTTESDDENKEKVLENNNSLPNEEASNHIQVEACIEYIPDEDLINKSTFYISSPYALKLTNRKKSLTEKSYCLAKELLMTERTYRKDLEIIDILFREEYCVRPALQLPSVERLLCLVDPLYEEHCALLRDLEQRMAFWEGRPASRNVSGIKGFGDILLSHKSMIQCHSEYVRQLPGVLESLQQDLVEDGEFCSAYRHFESHKTCYLPLTSFLLRAAARLTHYHALLTEVLKCYNIQHVDYNNCINMLQELKTPCETFDSQILPLVNYVKLMDLQRSLVGFPHLVDKQREFIREGCLVKFTSHGTQQQMFILFSDEVVWAGRIRDNRFEVRGQMSTCGLQAEKSAESHLGLPHCFSLRMPPDVEVLVAAPSQQELCRWLSDFSLSSCPGSPPCVARIALETPEEEDVVSDLNTSFHICWHRNISIGRHDLLRALKHSISGYLLRKFKNSSGWQKVWVVLANFCLFFYRSYSDESPLASLPLAGYRVSGTTSRDSVRGDLIFKVAFKSHEYFFTVDNGHTKDRWMEAISICSLAAEEENTRL